MVKKRFKKTIQPFEIYNYWVQHWTSIDNGKTFSYFGFGEFCQTEEEADAYIKKMEAMEQNQKESEELLTGRFYCMDCMNAFVKGIYPISVFSDDAEAIKKASDYEASLYKYEYKDGIRVSNKILYEPCFA